MGLGVGGVASLRVGQRPKNIPVMVEEGRKYVSLGVREAGRLSQPWGCASNVYRYFVDQANLGQSWLTFSGDLS